MAWLTGMVWYTQAVFQALQLALTLNPQALQVIEKNLVAGQATRADSVVLGILFLAGVSTLIGQAVVLFASRVKPRRFFFSLGLNGLLFILLYLTWGTTIWVIGNLLFTFKADYLGVARLVALSVAPLIFGFMILIPYLGQTIERLLYAWSFLILLGVTESTFHVGILRALVCLSLSWALMALLAVTLGRPVIALRNLLWHRLVGSPIDATAQDILLIVARENLQDENSRGDAAC